VSARIASGPSKGTITIDAPQQAETRRACRQAEWAHTDGERTKAADVTRIPDVPSCSAANSI
jgi:hypothetical protein